jgi:hypothetical protein
MMISPSCSPPLENETNSGLRPSSMKAGPSAPINARGYRGTLIAMIASRPSVPFCRMRSVLPEFQVLADPKPLRRLHWQAMKILRWQLDLPRRVFVPVAKRGVFVTAGNSPLGSEWTFREVCSGNPLKSLDKGTKRDGQSGTARPPHRSVLADAWRARRDPADEPARWLRVRHDPRPPDQDWRARRSPM